MKKQEYLFELIKSLTATEKRYFKLSASALRNGSNYIKLFNAINKQKEYDEVAIKQKFKNEIFVRQLHVTKYGLYKLVLKSLRNFHSEISIESQLNEMLRDMELLYSKGLYDQCESIVTKLKKLAIEYEKPLKYISAINWELQLMSRERYMNHTKDHILSIYEDADHAIKDIYNTYHIYRFGSLFFSSLHKHGVMRDASQIKEFEKIIKEAQHFYKKHELSDYAKRNYYNLLAEYYNVIDDTTPHYNYRKKIVESLEINPVLIEENLERYIGALYNFLGAIYHTDEKEEFYATLEKLRLIPITHKNAEENIVIKIFTLSTELELIFYNKHKELFKALSAIPAIENKLKQYDDKIPQANKLLIYHNIACLFFMAREYKQALKWVNKILNHNDETYRPDILCKTKILNLFIHFELGNDSLLEYTVKSTYRFLKDRKRMYRFENMVLLFVEKIVRADTQKKLSHEFSELKKSLLLLSEDSYEYSAYKELGLIEWLNEKSASK